MTRDELWENLQKATAALNLALLLLRHGGDFDKNYDSILAGVDALEDAKRELARLEENGNYHI